MKYLIIIERYLNGNLIEDELNDFRNQLEVNPLLKKEFEAFKKLHEFLGSNGSSLSEDIKKMKDFELDPDIYLDILKYGGPLSPDEEDIDIPR